MMLRLDNRLNVEAVKRVPVYFAPQLIALLVRV